MGCGVMSRYWQDIDTPLLIVASQQDPVYYKDSPCTPRVADTQYENYKAAWRRGVVDLAESIQANRPDKTSCFVPSCSSHTLLTGSLARVYFGRLHVPIIKGEGTLTLMKMLDGWLRSDYQQAVDPLGQENSQCPSSSPLRKACGNLLGCGTRIGEPRSKSVYPAQSFNRRLLPPTSLFPTSYSRKCNLDPWYGACGRQAVSSVLDSGHGIGHGTVHVAAHSGIALDDAGRRKKLWQKLYKLQYLKKLFNKYKQAYAREYHGVDAHPVVRVETRPVVVRAETRPVVVRAERRPVVIREKSFPAIFRARRPQRPQVIFAQRRVPSVTVERPPIRTLPDVLPSVASPDYDYAAYDYAEYYDYAQGPQGGCNKGCALSKIIRAVQLKKKKQTAEVAKTDIPAGGDDAELLESFSEFLAESDLDYEDFSESLSSQVETFDEDLLKLQARKKALI